MTVFSVVDAKPWHAGQMARRLRAGHLKAIGRASRSIHRDLAQTANSSLICRAWMIDGQLAGLGGVNGAISGRIGYIWLALSDLAVEHPLAVMREVKKQIGEFMETRRELRTSIVEGDRPARAFVIRLGFEPSCDEEPMDINGVTFYPMVYRGR